MCNYKSITQGNAAVNVDTNGDYLLRYNEFIPMTV